MVAGRRSRATLRVADLGGELPELGQRLRRVSSPIHGTSAKTAPEGLDEVVDEPDHVPPWRAGGKWRST
jgi:hypothetical protein